jgi:gliding motility-associated-like protein
LVVGSNGLLTFDTTNAAPCDNAWTITPTIPFAGGAQCQANSTYYPKASIMGNYSDLDPRTSASPGDRKIEWRVEGNAPCRRFIASFYHLGVFGNNSCGLSTPTTFQIVIYESTSIIEVYFENKTCQSSTTGGRAILGVQDWTQSRALAAAGKNSTVWTAQNEAYRFIPSGGSTRFVNSQLYTLGGTLVATATTSFAIPGSVGLTFNNICPSSNSEQFIVRTTYQSCSDPNGTLVYEDTITINKTVSLNATTNVTNLNCATGSTGTITVTVPPGNGVPPYQYSLNGGPLQSSNTFTGLAVGNYTVFATDINGCSSTLNVTVNRIGNLGVGYTSINSSCSGVNNGSITILPPSVYTPIQYSLNGGAPQTSNVFSGLAAGTYTISVTDAIGCTGSTTITITQGGNVTATGSMTPTSCSGSNNGTITVFASGGSLPYQYSLNGGTPQASNVFTGLTAGTYSIRVIDVNGCFTTFSITVSPGTPLNASVTRTDVLCYGESTGTITINISNGAPPYQYSLDNANWQTSNSFTGLAAGAYTVYYKDNNACSNSQTVNIFQSALLDVTASSINPRCFGNNDGAITANGLGGTSPYQYSLDNVNWQTANTFNNLAAGLYTVYCRDINGCDTSMLLVIPQPPQIIASASTVNASCNGGADGKIIVTASGGIGTLQYSIDGTNFQTSNVFNVLPGTYTVTIKDANNCSASQSITVGLTNNLSINPAPDVTICEGKSIQLNVNTNATQFSWSPAVGLSNAAIQNPVANPTTTTQYIVTANFGQCSGKDTIVVNVNAAPIPNAGPDVEICYGQDYQLQGSGGVQYIWNPPSTLSNGALPNPVSSPQQTITYSLMVIDANGCSSLVPDQMSVTVTPPIIVKANPKDTVVFAGDQFQLSVSSAATNFSWSPATGLSNPFSANPTLTVTSDITYNIIATTAAGCRGDGTVTVKVFKGPEIYMPTGFTPNGDGKNDIFKPFTVGITKLNYFKVYNRWGRLLYSTSNLNEGWDGRIGGVDQPTSTFVWMVQGVARDGKVITKKGTVTLIR